MSDNQDGQIGRAVIRPVVVKFLIAGITGCVHLEIAVQQRPIAAFRAFAPPPFGQRRPKFAFIRCGLG